MSFVIGLVIGFVGGVITAFLFSRKNPAIVKKADVIETKTLTAVSTIVAAVEENK